MFLALDGSTLSLLGELKRMGTFAQSLDEQNGRKHSPRKVATKSDHPKHYLRYRQYEEECQMISNGQLHQIVRCVINAAK